MSLRQSVYGQINGQTYSESQQEVLALARINWNTAFDTTGAPIVLDSRDKLVELWLKYALPTNRTHRMVSTCEADGG